MSVSQLCFSSKRYTFLLSPPPLAVVPVGISTLSGKSMSSLFELFQENLFYLVVLSQVVRRR